MPLTSIKLHLNFAVRRSVDGELAYGPRTSCVADLQRCHEMRETFDAILVGAETFRSECPRLTARRQYLGRDPLKQPIPIIATKTGGLSLPQGFVELLCADGDIEAGLERLALQGVHTVFVEGGPTLHRALLQRHLYNTATIYIHGGEPEMVMPGLYTLLPGLPRNFKIRPFGEGFLVQFDFRQIVVAPNRSAECALPSDYGEARLIAFEDPTQGLEHAIVTFGDLASDDKIPPLLRIHSACCTGDLFGSKRCDCGQQLHSALNMIKAEGRGILIYLNQEGRGIGLLSKVMAYTLQEEGVDTYKANERLGLPADARDFQFAVHALRRLGIRKIRLLTNNPEKIRDVIAGGIEVTEQVTLGGAINETNRAYLMAKVSLSQHHPNLLK